MSGFRGSFWGKKVDARTVVEPKPEPTNENIARGVPAAALTASQMRQQNIPTQISRALRDEMLARKTTEATMADILGIRWETVVRLLEGRMFKPATLERICFKLGWQIRIHDRMGRCIVTYPPAEGS